LNTAPSSPPKRSIADVTIAALPSSVDTSTAHAIASSRPLTHTKSRSLMSTATTRPPAASRRSHNARPIPVAAPVTTVTLMR